MSTDLHVEVAKLRTWLATNRWVDQYDRWWSNDGVVGAFQDFLARVALEDWSEENVTDVLYLLEQSSTGYIAELVTQSEAMALAVARYSLARGGVASDDIAEQLGHCTAHRDEAEALLIAFMGDPHERTRRLALLALAQLQSAAVPALAEAAWDSGDEYARIGALSALGTIGSALFPTYLARAFEDGREHLVAFARRYADELARAAKRP